MVNRISIALALLISFVSLNCSVPRYIQAAKPPIAPRAMPRPAAMPKPSIVEPEKELPAPVVKEETSEGKEAIAPAADEPVIEKNEEEAVETEEAAPEKSETAPVVAAEEKAPEVKEGAQVDEMDIDITPNSRSVVTALLNTLLADEYILAVKAQNFHWNIRNSMNFNDLHLFFGKMYTELSGIIDIIAERIRIVGGHPFGTMAQFVKNARIHEQEGVPTDKEMIKKLLDDSQAIIRTLRANIQKTAELNDVGTNSMLSDLISKHEKTAWMLRSYLK